jgi:aspartyl/asparaginyl beta-hydroxylase (cupin superfamily)
MPGRQRELWFRSDGRPFNGNEPFFFNTEDFPWVKRIESQWLVIREELMMLIHEHENSLVPYAISGLTSKPNQWRTFGLMFWTIKSRENCRKCPKTWELIKSIPNVLAASFNLLEANTAIKPHHGDTNAIIRCHLGLQIPAPAPQCAFRVGSETRSWEEGKLHMFCDAHSHTSWNNTNQKRYILLIDVMRPEYAAQTKAICGRVLARLNLAVAYQRKEWLRQYFGGRRRKAIVQSLTTKFFQLALYAHLPIPSLPS